MSIIKALVKASRKKPLLFTTPGHCQNGNINKEIKSLIGSKVFKADFSEIDGLDNLQHPTGVIKTSMECISNIYGSKESFFLINGSTSGIIALMLSLANENDKILVARNSHKSLINAMVLSGARPVWINTSWLNEWDISGIVNPIDVIQALNNNPDIKAVWITSPTYEGVVSDVKVIAEICKEFNIPLIVDEAHGALWNFSKELPTPAIQLGADASVQSLHKTGNCLTQGAILHVSKNSKINPLKLQDSLNIINTTSPSYILLASIESSINYLSSNKGQKELDRLLNNIDEFKNLMKKKCDISFLESCKLYQTDKTKICFSIKGLSGYDIAEYTETKHYIEVELCNDKSVMALTGIGTTESKLRKLANTIIQAEKMLNSKEYSTNTHTFINPILIYTPREAFFTEKEIIEVNKSIGRVSGETIVPYPPGIPVLIEGELIQEEHLQFINNKQISVIKI